MRHAKAGTSAISDHARPLTERGRHDAVRVAQELSRRGWLPDQVLVSDAERTLETLAWLHETWGLVRPTRIEASLYLPGVGDLLKAIAAASESARTVLVVSHNSGCEELVSWLTAQPVQLTTANVARLVSPAPSWAAFAARPGAATLEHLLRPADLRPR